jgi:hypothetical protein
MAMIASLNQGFLHFGHGNRRHVLDEKHEEKKEQAEAAEHDAELDKGRSV